MPSMKRPAAVTTGCARPAKASKCKAAQAELTQPAMVAVPKPTPKLAPTSSATQVTPAPKQSKPTGPHAQVIKGLGVSDLPQTAKDTLVEMLVPSLSVGKEKRDKYQNKVVEMIGSVLSDVDEALQRKVEEIGTLIAENAQETEEVERKVAAKLSEMELKCSDVLAKKRELAEVAVSFKRARETAREAKAREASVESEAKSKSEERDRMMVIREEFLASGEGEADSDLVQRVTSLDMSDSMLAALPAVLAKPPSQRGSFDLMVLTSVREELDSRIAEADKVIQNAEPTKAACADARSKAEADLKEASAQQVDGAAAFCKVRDEAEELEKGVSALCLAARKLKEISRKHSATNNKAKSSLEVFRNGPKQAFEELREAAGAEAQPTEAFEDLREAPGVEAQHAELILHKAAREQTASVM